MTLSSSNSKTPHGTSSARALKTCSLLIALLLLPGIGLADIQVRDDRGKHMVLTKPAARIVSLAPHVTEMLFAIGAGDKLVGVVDFSDFPTQAKKIPRIGRFDNFDYEQIKLLKPDIIVGWQSGNPAEKIAHLEALGFNVYLTEPHSFSAIASNVARLAVLTDTQAQAAKPIADFNQTIADLARTYSDKKKVTLFYEIWNDPLMTLNGEHLFQAVMDVCGASNVFASLPVLAPKISVEAVLAANPQMILASGMDEARPEWLDHWLRWPQLQAVKHKHLYFVPPDLLQRHGLRIAQGAQQVCEQVEKVRKTMR